MTGACPLLSARNRNVVEKRTIDDILSKKAGGHDMSNLYTAIIHREEKLYVAECPEVGTASQGYTIEEAISNLKEATELYLEEFPITSVTHPILTTFEIPVHG